MTNKRISDTEIAAYRSMFPEECIGLDDWEIVAILDESIPDTFEEKK